MNEEKFEDLNPQNDIENVIMFETEKPVDVFE